MRRMILALLSIYLLISSGCVEESSKTAVPTVITRTESLPADIRKVTPEEDVYPPILHASEWHPPVPMPGLVNTCGAEDSPFITADGQRFLFVFTPDVRVPVEKQLIDGVTGIYLSHFVAGSWVEPQRVILQDSGKLSLDGCHFLRGEVLWFCSVREGYTGVHWFTADFSEELASNWQNADFDPAFGVGELHIFGDELYYHSSRPGGLGASDIWMLKFIDGAWVDPVNITAVNSTEPEGMPFISDSGDELWFNRRYLGSPAIFRSLRVDGEWGEPELILSQFAGEPNLDAAGNIYFVHHYYRDGVMLEADIYVAYKK